MCGRKPCDKPDCTWSRHHMRLCEARYVLKMAREHRRHYLGMVEAKRGRESAVKLEETVLLEHKRARK